MSERLEVVITGQDGVSKTFVAVSRGAEQAGKSVEQAGKRGAQGMKELGREAQDSSRKMDDMKAAATAVGAVFGVLATGAIKAGAAYKDQRLDLQSLEDQYGSAADRIIDFTEVMQDSFNTSNDAARDVALTYATLFRNFEIGETQIQELMERTADISAARGRNAVEVSQMIQNALRGEAEYIEQIGVTLNDNFVASQYAARGLGEWTKVTDEATKAAFRYQLLMEQTIDTQGRAAEEAERSGGQFRLFLNEMQDAGQAVGQFLGPIGEVAAEMAPIAMALPVVTAGLGRMVAAGRSSTLVMSALGAAFNPVTIGVGAVIGLGALLYKEFTEVGEAARELDASLATLTDTLEQLRLSGDAATSARLETTLAEIEAIQMVLEASNLEQMNRLLGTSFESALDFDTAAVRDDLQRVADITADVTNQIAANMRGLTAEQQQIYLDWVNAMIDGAVTTMEDSDLDDRLNEILITPVSEVLNQGMVDLEQAMARGSITWAQYQEAIAETGDELETFADDTKEATFALDEIAERANLAADAIASAGSAAGSFAAANMENLSQLYEDVAAAAAAWRELNAEISGVMLELTGNTDLASRLNLVGLATDAIQAADDIGKLAIGLDSVLAIYGQIDAMGQRYQGAVSIVDSLFGDGGDPSDGLGPLVELLNAGRIEYEQFQDAVERGIRIQERAAGVEMSLNEIRVDQLPLLEQTSSAYADYIDKIAAMTDASEQAVALGWMDDGLQGRVQQVLDLSNQLDDMGLAGERAMQQVIDGIVATDPVLTAMLEDLGLITRELDGSYTFDLDAAGAMSDIERLTMSIDALTLALGGTPPTYDIEVTGAEDVDAATGALERLQELAQNSRIQVPVEYQMPEERDWARDGYLGGWGQEPVTVPVNLEVPDGFDPSGLVPDAVPIDITLPDDVPTLLIPTEVEEPEIPVTFWDWQNEGAAAITISANDEATPVIDDVRSSANDLAETSCNVTITGDESAAMASIGAVGHNLATLDGSTALVVINAQDNATAVIQDVGSSLAGLDAASATVMIYGNADDAYADIADIQAYNGTILATSYMDIVTRYSSSGSPTMAHGGVVEEYASGGVVIRAGEVGEEIAHFPMGGTALLPRDGLYNVPAGTYISPHNAVSGYGGITINFNGSFYGSNRQELDEWAEQSLLPTIGEVIDERWEGLVTP